MLQQPALPDLYDDSIFDSSSYGGSVEIGSLLADGSQQADGEAASRDQANIEDSSQTVPKMRPTSTSTF